MGDLLSMNPDYAKSVALKKKLEELCEGVSISVCSTAIGLLATSALTQLELDEPGCNATEYFIEALRNSVRDSVKLNKET